MLIKSFAVLIVSLWFIHAPNAHTAERGFESARVCKECHGDIYRSWKKSLHALSYTNKIFMTGYRKAYLETKGDAKKYCLNCHAPTVRVSKDYDVDLPVTKEGVTCDFCHSISGVDLANRHDPFILQPGKTKFSSRGRGESDHHQTAIAKDMGSSKLCAGCHDFANLRGLKVGMTYEEWGQSRYSKEGKQCQGCHMRYIPGMTADDDGREMIHDHSIPHNTLSMYDAVSVEIGKTVRRNNEIAVDIEVENNRAGHHLPTGIPDQLVLEAVTLDVGGATIETKKIVYQAVILDENGEEIHDDGDVFLYGVTVKSDNRLKLGEKRREKIVFSKNVKKINAIEAEAYFLHRPTIEERTLMRVLFFKTKKVIK